METTQKLTSQTIESALDSAEYKLKSARETFIVTEAWSIARILGTISSPDQNPASTTTSHNKFRFILSLAAYQRELSNAV